MSDFLSLIGMMGCGKSTIGRLLAATLGFSFVDADEETARMAGRTIPELFAVSEEHFRDWETRTLRALVGRRDTVLACGGGAVLRMENVALLRARGPVVYIRRPVERILPDITPEGRPLLRDGVDALYAIARAREPLYLAAATVTVDNLQAPEDAAAAIMGLFRPNTCNI